MSAVVAGHHNIARLLLHAAGEQVAGLVAAQNKYKSTALHLAAYRGSLPTIRLLLQYQSKGAVGSRDAQGLTPAQIARKHSHRAAEMLLTRRPIEVQAC